VSHLRYRYWLQLDVDAIDIWHGPELAVRLQDGIYVLGDKFLHLLRGPTDKQDWIDHAIQLFVHGAKGGIVRNARQQVIGQSLSLDDRAGRHGMDANLFVQFLTVATGLYTCVCIHMYVCWCVCIYKNGSQFQCKYVCESEIHGPVQHSCVRSRV
jgi:hypothetical protein